jgi:hypothetical protein
MFDRLYSSHETIRDPMAPAAVHLETIAALFTRAHEVPSIDDYLAHVHVQPYRFGAGCKNTAFDVSNQP